MDSTNSNRPIIDWSWGFGDGNFSNIENPIHQYLSAGLFGLCVLQANGGIDSQEIERSIKELIKASSLNKHNKPIKQD